MKGIVALDIDGTITIDHHSIEPKVVSYLTLLNDLGWKIVFITGRTFKWGYEVLHYLNCPYYFAVQNGAILIEMPSRKLLAKKYLDHSYLPIMENACQGEPSSFVIYGGYEFEDICFYRPNSFSSQMLSYINLRKETFKENWTEVESFENLPIKEFASLKAFGTLDSAKRIISRIENSSGLHVPLIHDPFQKDRYVIQATHPFVSKGEAVKDLKKILDSTFVIAAGDDNNDRSMLAIADVKIVMATAPDDMLKDADIIAPPAEQMGIIEGLTTALNKLG